MLWKIALRNILRHKRRTILSSITIGFGMMFFVYMDSIMSGMDRGSIDNLLNLSTGAVTVQSNDYYENRRTFPLDFGLDRYPEIAMFLLHNENVRAVTKRTQFLGELSNFEESMPVTGVVIDPGTDTTVFSLPSTIESGHWFSKESHHEIILGEQLAEKLGVGVGDEITLYALTRYEGRNADDFEIAGLITSTDPRLSRSSVLISFDAANDFLDLDNLVTEAVVAVDRSQNFGAMMKTMERVQAAVLEQFPGYTVKTFKELSGGFLKTTEAKRKFGYIFLSVILLIAAIGIFNTVLMSVYERIREVGVLRAHGMLPKTVTTMFVLEGFLTGVSGSILGVFLGGALNFVLVTYGVPFDKMVGDIDVSGFPYLGTIYGQWNPATFVFMVIFALVASTLAGLIPARKAGALAVTDALRFV